MEILQTALICVHAVAAGFVIVFGPVNFLRRRKDSRHKLLGRIFAVMMAFVCISGMFIYSIGGFTIFHALAILNFSCTAISILAIRKGNVPLHRGMMIGGWLGTIIAGAFAVLVPGRRIPTLAAHDPAMLWTIVTIVVAAAATVVILVLRRSSHPRLVSPQSLGQTANRIDTR